MTPQEVASLAAGVALLLAAALMVVPRRGMPRGAALALLDPGPSAADGAEEAWTDPAADDPLVRVRRRCAEMVARLRRRGRPVLAEEDLLGLLEAVGAGLRAGLAPADSLAVAGAAMGPDQESAALRSALAGLTVRARAGESVGEGWTRLAREHDSREVLLLARAWSLSESTGAPIASAVDTALRLMRDDRDQRRRTDTAVAGARTTMTILSALPLGGPALAAFMGVDLGELYLRSPLVWACLAVGLVLVGLGRWWVARLVAATLKGPMLR